MCWANRAAWIPFHVRQLNADEMVEEVDQSDELLAKLKAEKIDALISVVGGQGLTILYKLHAQRAQHRVRPPGDRE